MPVLCGPFFCLPLNIKRNFSPTITLPNFWFTYSHLCMLYIFYVKQSDVSDLSLANYYIFVTVLANWLPPGFPAFNDYEKVLIAGGKMTVLFWHFFSQQLYDFKKRATFLMLHRYFYCLMVYYLCEWRLFHEHNQLFSKHAKESLLSELFVSCVQHWHMIYVKQCDLFFLHGEAFIFRGVKFFGIVAQGN